MKKSSKKIQNSNSKHNKLTSEQEAKLEEKLAELSEEEIEKLFELGKIDQIEFEAIMMLKKRKKKKTQKEKFEERIRCDQTIIDKIVNLGRIFRMKENNVKRQNALDSMIQQEEDLEREERVREKSERVKERGARSKGRDRTRERGGFERGR